MPWTYDSALSTTKDRVRFTVGDTNFDDQQVQDEEIAFLLTAAGDDVLTAAKGVVRHLIAHYARGVDKWVGDLKTLASQRVDHYERLLDRLEAQGSMSVSFVGVPTAGGVYESDKRLNENRTDLAEPAFTRNQFDYGREYPRRITTDSE